MSKLVVCFPGIGYHCDKPLLYYARKLARESGFDQEICLEYGYHPENIRGDEKKMQRTEEILFARAEDVLKNIVWDEYEEILFISKSIGTTIAARYEEKYGIFCKNVLYTPLENTLKYSLGNPVVFIGTNDPWSNVSNILDLCKNNSIIYHVYESANHSLECGDTQLDLVNLMDIMKKTEQFIKNNLRMK